MEASKDGNANGKKDPEQGQAESESGQSVQIRVTSLMKTEQTDGDGENMILLKI